MVLIKDNAMESLFGFGAEDRCREHGWVSFSEVTKENQLVRPV